MRLNFIFIWSILFLRLTVQDLSAQKSIHAFPLKEAPQIDGKFEPGIWSGADSASAFIQMEPKPGQPASEATSAWIGCDGENVYAVFRCYQRLPVIAKNQSRD